MRAGKATWTLYARYTPGIYDSNADLLADTKVPYRVLPTTPRCVHQLHNRVQE